MPRDVKKSANIDRENPVDHFRIHHGEAGGPLRDACIVDKHADTAPFGFDACNRLAGACIVRDIEKAGRSLTAARANIARHLAGSVRIPVGEHDPRALCREAAGNGRAKPRRRACNQCDLSLKHHRAQSPMGRMGLLPSHFAASSRIC